MSFFFFSIVDAFCFAYKLLQLAYGLLHDSGHGKLGRMGSKSDRQLGLAHRLIGVASQLVR